MKTGWKWAVGIGIVVATVAVYFINPATVNFLPPCLLHATTGLHCPGCGSTRALHQLAHGNVGVALRLNPLTVLALPALGFLVVRREKYFVKPLWVWTALGVVVVFGVVRNIPVYPFTLLAP